MLDPSVTQTSICPAMLPTEASLASAGYAHREPFEYETQASHEMMEADKAYGRREASLMLRLLQAACGGFAWLYQRARVADAVKPAIEEQTIGILCESNQGTQESDDSVISRAA